MNICLFISTAILKSAKIKFYNLILKKREKKGKWERNVSMKKKKEKEKDSYKKQKEKITKKKVEEEW